MAKIRPVQFQSVLGGSLWPVGERVQASGPGLQRVLEEQTEQASRDRHPSLMAPKAFRAPGSQERAAPGPSVS